MEYNLKKIKQCRNYFAMKRAVEGFERELREKLEHWYVEWDYDQLIAIEQLIKEVLGDA